MKMTVRLFGAIAMMGAALSAQAAPVVYDFSGSGQLCTYTGVADNATCADKTFTGTVTLNVLANAGSGGDGVTNAFADSGWIEPDIFIQWAGGSFNAAPTPAPTHSDWYTQVWNDLIGIDQLVTREYYLGQTDDGLLYWSYAYFNRYTFTNPSWLQDVSFDLDAGLATGASSMNYIGFDQHSGRLDAGAPLAWNGFYGGIDLTSLVMRPIAVPEPAPWTLVVLGLAGLSLAGHMRATGRKQGMREFASKQTIARKS